MTDPVARLNAALEGRYRIERELGEGGMATVYLADDLRHERKVALKVLKPELAAVVGAERFLAEIKTTANLQHPHILPLFDSGEEDGFLYYVMPYVEGESLRERLARERQLPVDEAVGIAHDVADALQAAHEKGVIHRDIKPANILLSRGRPLVADFGIALAVSAAGGGRLTETGLSMGTPYYMSPEQASADREPTAASDVYSLGCVLYEMLAGEPPYVGGSAQAVLAKILTDDAPAPAEARPSVPVHVDAAIRKALEKLPADRFTSVRDFAVALSDAGFRYRQPAAGLGAVTDGGPWKATTIGLAATSVGLLVALLWSLGNGETPRAVERFSSPFLPDHEPSTFPWFDLFEDGSAVVYERAGELWIRRWNNVEASPLRGSEDGTQPSVSPDGSRIAFNQNGEIKVLSLEGDPPQPLGTGTWPLWGPDGFIYLSVDSGTARVSVQGGPARAVSSFLPGDVTQMVTDVLPGGEQALLNVGLAGGLSELRIVNLVTGEMTPLLPLDESSAMPSRTEGPRHTPTGHLLWSDGVTLWAAAFDASSGEVTGPPAVVLEGVRAFAMSGNGKLFYSSAGSFAESQAVWVSRSGVVTPVDPAWTFGAGSGNVAIDISPDGTRLAVRDLSGNADVWIKELDHGPYSRLTFDEGLDWGPRWAPDGRTVTFLSNRRGDRDVWSKAADGTGQAELVFDYERDIAEAFLSPDGAWLVFRPAGQAGTGNIASRDIWAVRPGVDSVARPLVATPDYSENAPALSPNGRWLAYNSDETGRFEVYVRPFPDVDAGRVQVSTNGGGAPVWSHSGRELFYINGQRQMVAAAVETDSTARVVSQEVLFDVPVSHLTPTSGGYYDIDPADERFVMVRVLQESVGRSPFMLVNNFFHELRQRVPTN